MSREIDMNMIGTTDFRHLMDDSQSLNMTNLNESMSRASYQRIQTLKLSNKYKKMPTYMLNDFDDNYSVSDAADLSVISGSMKHFGGTFLGQSLVFEAGN